MGFQYEELSVLGRLHKVSLLDNKNDNGFGVQAFFLSGPKKKPISFQGNMQVFAIAVEAGFRC